MFDEFARDLKKLEADVPKIFTKVAKKGAVKFVKEAKKKTDKEGLVDTGAYKGAWFAEAVDLGGVAAIDCTNNMDYAMHLEKGHKLRNGGRWKGRFVGRQSILETSAYCYFQLANELDKAHNKYLKGN